MISDSVKAVEGFTRVVSVAGGSFCGDMIVGVRWCFDTSLALKGTVVSRND